MFLYNLIPFLFFLRGKKKNFVYFFLQAFYGQFLLSAHDRQSYLYISSFQSPLFTLLLIYHYLTYKLTKYQKVINIKPMIELPFQLN